MKWQQGTKIRAKGAQEDQCGEVLEIFKKQILRFIWKQQSKSLRSHSPPRLYLLSLPCVCVLASPYFFSVMMVLILILWPRHILNGINYCQCFGCKWKDEKLAKSLAAETSLKSHKTTEGADKKWAVWGERMWVSGATHCDRAPIGSALWVQRIRCI